LPTNTTSITSANDASLSTTNGGNIIDINVDGGASGAGHVIDLDLDGAANVVTIDQSGTAQNTVVLDATTNGSTIDITQSD
jgi:predicted nicotinamide N-methyase